MFNALHKPLCRRAKVLHKWLGGECQHERIISTLHKHMATTIEEDRAIRLAKQATDLVDSGRAEVSTLLNFATAVADWWGARRELER